MRKQQHELRDGIGRGSGCSRFTVQLFTIVVGLLTFNVMSFVVRHCRNYKNCRATAKQESYFCSSCTGAGSPGLQRGIGQNSWHKTQYLARHTFPSSCSFFSTQLLASLPITETKESMNTTHNKKNNLATTTNPRSNDGNNNCTDTKHTPYEEWVRRLYRTNLFNPVKLGLQSTGQLYELIGKPLDDDNIVVIHIAGTNGKGSVALKIAKTLELINPSLKVGLFCSPHVSSFRERMQVDGELISEEEVTEYLSQIYKHCEEHDIPATFFEITTILAFLFYSKRKADFVVLETGLGGRLDSTNIISSPALSIITSIGLEHTNILGDTVELIAKEKAGIIKPNCPVLVGPNCPHDVIQHCAIEKDSGAYYTCDDVLGSPVTATTTTTDFVDYDKENIRIATAALKLLQDSNAVPKLTQEKIQDGTSQRPPCRFECIQVSMPLSKFTPAAATGATASQGSLPVILDVAHNPPAMQHLVQKLKYTYPQQYKDKKFRVIVGMSRDKDMKLTFEYLSNLVGGDTQSLHFVEGFHPRAMKLEDILMHVPTTTATPERTTTTTDCQENNYNCHYDLQDRSVTKQLQIATDLAGKTNYDEIIVVCGSVFLMAEAREALGFNEPRDSDAISEMAGINFKHTQENFADDEKKGEKK